MKKFPVDMTPNLGNSMDEFHLTSLFFYVIAVEIFYHVKSRYTCIHVLVYIGNEWRTRAKDSTSSSIL